MAAAARTGRAKRVTDPLDDEVKACLEGHGCHSAGSTIGGCGGRDVDGELFGSVDGCFFSSDSEGPKSCAPADDGENYRDTGCFSEEYLPSAVSRAMVDRDVLRSSIDSGGSAGFLEADVTKALERFDGLRPNRSAFRWAVMSSLRESGHNAGICRTTWESDGAITAGSYEYIDVVSTPQDSPASRRRRYVVDVDFAGEFEIARPTAAYGGLLAELPRVFVGKPDELKRLLDLLADAAKRSLQARGMCLPPWRKRRYMRAKWLGPHRRVIEPGLPVKETLPTSGTAVVASGPPSCAVGREVKFRCVGFDPSATAAKRPTLILPPFRCDDVDEVPNVVARRQCTVDVEGRRAPAAA